MPGCFGLTSEVYLLLQVVSTTVYLSAMPQLLQSRICHNLYNSTICKKLAAEEYKTFADQVQAKASYWMTVVPTSGLVLSSVMILFVGPLADRVGKRNLMIFSPLLVFAQGVLYLVLVSLPGHFHPAWLLVPEFVSGILGGTNGDILLSLAYKADITSLESRTPGISNTEGFYYVGIATFSIVTGLLLKVSGFHAAFALYLVASTVNLLYVLFLLPDERTLMRTNNEDEQREVLLKDRSVDDNLNSQKDNTSLESEKTPSRLTVKSLLLFEDIRRILTGKTHGRAVLIYLFLLFVARICRMGTLYLVVLYVKHPPFNMTADAVGFYAAITFGLVGIGCWTTIPMLQRFCKVKDQRLLVLGFFWQAINRLFMGLATSPWILYANSLTEILGGITIPVLRSMLTKCVPEDLHGTVLALGGLIGAISSLVGNFFGNIVYSKTVSIYPGIAMFALASLSLIGLIVSMLLLCRRDGNNPV